jgi:hypothetical protein
VCPAGASVGLSDVQPRLGISAGRDNRKILMVPALGHALDFLTWRSLVHEQGLTDEEAIELMVGMVRNFC